MRRFFMTTVFSLFFIVYSYAQLDKKDMCEFSVKLYERRLTNYGYTNPRLGDGFTLKVNNVLYTGTVAISNYFMERAFHDFNPNSLKKRFGNLCSNYSDFDKYIYQILVEGEGDKQNFVYLASAFCGNKVLANKLYSYLINRYSNKLSGDVNKLKIEDNNLKKENTINEPLSDSARKYEARLNNYYNKLKEYASSPQFTQTASGKNGNSANSVFNLAEFGIDVLSSGTLISSAKKDSIISLKVQKDYYVKNLYFTQSKSDLIILAEFNSGIDGYSSIQCVDIISKKVKWELEINGINLSKGLIEDNYAYISCMGIISKVNLETGKFEWKHESLFEKYKCNNFVDIQIAKEFVRLVGVNPAGKIIGKSRFDDIVSFICEKNSGQILSIENKIPND